MISLRKQKPSTSLSKKRRHQRELSELHQEPSQDGDPAVSLKAGDGAENGTDHHIEEAHGDQEDLTTSMEEADLTRQEEDATLARERTTTT